ncbi:hypothetical protein [Deferrisoma camini]|uniref:hypothetical protein n=1 Tax=Deferrisoma camini TaxID=1035120 RepID=UPI00046CF2E6|nr:hypothetical protein [Deferrisoma camini]
MQIDVDELIRVLEKAAAYAETEEGQRQVRAMMTATDDVDQHLEVLRFLSAALSHRPEEH